jgi:general secretion pathway protein G
MRAALMSDTESSGGEAIAVRLWSVGFPMPTDEHKLALALRPIGPFIAIGQPGERHRELGAAREYVADEEWQERVHDLLVESRLTVIRVGTTEDLWWEVEEALRTIPPERLLFVLPRDVSGWISRIQRFFGRGPTQAVAAYARFREITGKYLKHPLPEGLGDNNLLYFDAEAVPQLATEPVMRVDSLSHRYIERSYWKILRPVFELAEVDPIPTRSFFRTELFYSFGGAMALAVFSQVAAVLVAGEVERARAALARAQLLQVEHALELYRLDGGTFPTTDQGIHALVQRPSSGPGNKYYPSGGYLQNRETLVDPWGKQYGYESPGRRKPESFDFWTYGSDGAPGGSGSAADIGN